MFPYTWKISYRNKQKVNTSIDVYIRITEEEKGNEKVIHSTDMCNNGFGCIWV